MKFTKLITEGGESELEHRFQFASDVLKGLSAEKKFLLPKYFYDDAGSDLFQKITGHADYYLTNVEFDVLDRIKHDLHAHLDVARLDLVELGAGDGHKSKLVVDGLLDKSIEVNFCPIDISEMAMRQLQDNFEPRKGLSIHGVVAEYMQGVKYLRQNSSEKQLVLCLGSNVGNFGVKERREFLLNLWNNLEDGDYVLIGFDLKKDISKLVAAYNDSSGYTREFNLNFLRRMNRELGADFDTEAFYHHGFYNPTLGAMESHLVSLKEQRVYLKELKKHIHFEEYESIHMEYSYKFSKAGIARLAAEVGFETVTNFYDKDHYFVDALWKVRKT